MRALRWARRRVADAADGGERGASLILALAFLTLFGALLVTLLGFVQVAFLSNRRVHAQGERQYAMAGAIDADIQRARKDAAIGVSSCPDLTYSGVTVRCTPQANDGGAVPGTGATPANAILTLGGGITNNRSGSTLSVAGPVYANGPISLTADSVLDAEDLPVRGTSCGSNTTNWKYAEPIVSCPPIAGQAPPAGAGSDPGWNLDLAASPTARTLADVTCGGGGYYAYLPGAYRDVTVLTDTAKCPAAKARYFAPGTYYFDFTGTTQWAISGLPVIGGTATGWLGGSPPAAPSPTNLEATPTACSTGGPGVRFVFGGASTVTVAANARVELCPDPGGIVMYGQRASVPSSTDLLATDVSPLPSGNPCPATIDVTTPPCWRNSSTDAAFTPSRVLALDNQTAQAVVPEPSTNTAATDPLTLTFPAASVPAGWGGFDVAITVPHAELVTGSGGTVAINLTVGACGPFDIKGQAQNGGQVLTQLSKSTLTGQAYTCIKNTLASPFTVTYDPQLKKQGTQDAVLYGSLDGVGLTLTSVLPQPTKQDAKGVPALILASGAKFSAWGPVAMVNADFQVDASSDVIFDRGVVLNSLTANGGKPGVPVFRLDGGRRTMLLDATEGSKRMQALVTVTDYTAPGYWARIKRWNVKR